MATYYVAPNGNDSNPGSERQPFRTIQRGVNAASAGDTVYVMDGTYVEEVDAGRSGASGRPITIAAMPGHKPVIDGKAGENGINSGLPNGELVKVNPETGAGAKYTGLFDITGSHVIVDGFEIRNSMGRGMRIYSRSGETLNQVTVRNCKIHNSRQTSLLIQGNRTGSGDLTASNIEIVDSSLSWSGSYYPKRRAANAETDWAACVVFKSVKDSAVRRCQVFENWGESIIADANVGASTNITIEDNVIYDNFASNSLHAINGVVFQRNFIYRSADDKRRSNPFGPTEGVVIVPAEQVWMEQLPTRNVKVLNNIFVDCNVGIAMRGSAQKAEITDVLIANNTVVNASLGISPRTYNKRDIVFRNNIVYGKPGQTLVSDVDNRTASGWTYSNNMWSSRPSALQGSNDKIGDPLFENVDANPAAGQGSPNNYRLREGSPAIGAGFSIPEITVDHFGNSRSGSIDIGAHEYDSTPAIAVAFTIRDGNGSGSAPFAVTFDASGSSAAAGIARYEWDFGDGETAVASEPTQTHTYQSEGAYTVTLTVVDAKGNRNSLAKPEFISVTGGEGGSGRVTEGLQALYTFQEGSGGTVLDVSEVGEPLDLQIRNLSSVTWLEPGIALNAPSLVTSSGAATKIAEACKATNEITLEAWLKPDNTTQKGPARIITISKDGLERNITLGQGLWGTKPADLYDVRLRTTERSENGTPSLFTTPGSLTDGRTHVVFTRDKDGRARVYINNKLAAQDTIAGDLSGWNTRYPLLLGNETTNDRPWLGELYLVAVYDRALTPGEVTQNFDAGIAVERRPPEPEVAQEFKRFLVVNGNGDVTNRTVREMEEHVLAIGVQFPDNRCVICGKDDKSAMTIFEDVDAVEHAMLNEKTSIYWVD